MHRKRQEQPLCVYAGGLTETPHDEMYGRWATGRGQSIILMLTTAGVYLAAAKLGLTVAFGTQQVTPIWPASGLALAAVVLFGPSLWPGIWLGAFLANATTGEPLLTAASIATGNTLEPRGPLWLVRRFGPFDPALMRLRDVRRFVLWCAAVAPVIAASIGVGSLCVSGGHAWSESPALWIIWWVGD